MSYGRNASILVVSDIHAPYGHQDTVPFLTALDKKYAPTRVVLSGDEADKQALKFHTRDPDLPSCGDELTLAKAKLRPLFDLWPEADIMDSNHGSLAFRQATANGISRKYLRPYGEVLGAPEGWTWHREMLLTLPKGKRIFFHHGLSSDVARVVERRGYCVVQGHYHNSFEIKYVGNPDEALWGMTVGCLIDSKSLAFAYNTNNLGRPVLGCGIIIEGLPKLLPMLLNERGRWTGFVP